MEYFTRKAYETSQTAKGRKEWHLREKHYAAHLRSINPQLKGGWRQLATDHFEDEELRVVERPAYDQVILELDSHVFIFRGVKQVRMPEPSTKSTQWIRHEVHVVDDGTLELKVLLTDGEIRIAAEEAKVYRSEVSRHRVAV